MSDPVLRADEVLRRWSQGGDLCAPFTELLPVSGASISMFGSRGTHLTLCASDTRAVSLDEMHLKLGEGPRWEVAGTGHVVVSADLSQDVNPSWPMFSAGAAGLGVQALFAFPITIGGVMIGAVDLYRLAAGPLSADGMAQARALTRMVAGPAVARAIRSADQHDSPERAKSPALRREVHQATGMILIQLDVTKEDALALLKAHAFASDQSLDQVAADVVGRQLDFRDLRE